MSATHPPRPPRKSGNHFCDKGCRRKRTRKTYDQKDHLCLPNVPDSTRADGVGLLARCRMSSSRIHSLFTMTNSSADQRFRWRRNSRLSGFGGARRDRTDDLKLAKLPLSQLSYGPSFSMASGAGGDVRRLGLRATQARRPVGLADLRSEEPALDDVVGLGGFEPPTSRLSSARSNQLSYRPKANRPRSIGQSLAWPRMRRRQEPSPSRSSAFARKEKEKRRRRSSA